MPYNYNTNYKPSFFLRNKHLNTIYPNLFRKVNGVAYKRERLETLDKDFIDIDTSLVDNTHTAIVIVHGLEGNSHKAYVKGLVKTVNELDIDAFAVNLRGCSQEPNRLLSSYHSGKTDDLDLVIDFLNKKYKYRKILLAGFSLGGNLVLKYVGERGEGTPKSIYAAIAVSVPCDLKACALELSKPSNKLYLLKFLISLKKKAIAKIEMHGNDLVLKNKIKRAKNFYDFDNAFTGPIHGFKNANDYWKKSSSKQFLSTIQLPCFILNANDDPFLPESCYPYQEAKENHFILFEQTKYGGHVGFMTGYQFEGQLWHEKRIEKFIKSIV